MFDPIKATYCATRLPAWAQVPGAADYRRLYILRTVLETRQYDAQPYDFSQETQEGTEKYVPIAHRKPSVTVNLALGLARKISRKMFSGRQRPVLYHDDADAVTKIDTLLREGFFEQNLVRVALLGSVGACAMTFSILEDGKKDKRIVYNVHPADCCLPTFDALGELVKLRVQYVCQGIHFLQRNPVVARDLDGDRIVADQPYWYICDYTPEAVEEFVPIKESNYTPYQDPVVPDGKPLPRADPDRTTKHGLGFVPGHWFVNLSLGPLPWGGCYWESGINTATVLDFTASQLIRSLWYGGHPTLVTHGEVKNAEGGVITRGPDQVIQFDTDRRDAANNSIGGGDAKLLETNGKSFAETREAVELLRKLFMEQVQGSRKDPDRMRTTAMSGSAMEMMDDDLVDLMQGLRTDFGEQGMLTVVKKSVAAAKKLGHPLAVGIDLATIGGLALQWPLPFGLDAQETLALVQAVNLACGVGPAASGGGGGSAGGDGPKPAPAAPAVKPLLTPEEGRHLLLTNINIPQLARVPSRPQTPSREDE